MDAHRAGCKSNELNFRAKKSSALQKCKSLFFFKLNKGKIDFFPILKIKRPLNLVWPKKFYFYALPVGQNFIMEQMAKMAKPVPIDSLSAKFVTCFCFFFKKNKNRLGWSNKTLYPSGLTPIAF
ncbi:MAG: hypothetical protein R2830_07160 [Saprospiraceae bacterium]